MAAVTRIDAWESLDSRGHPTLGVRVELHDGCSGRAVAPQGASTGQFEVADLRDGDSRYGGRGNRGAARLAMGEFADRIRGATSSAEVDAAVTGGPSNITVALSIAASRAFARSARTPWWRHLNEVAGREPSMPVPMVNIFSGGRHAEGGGRIQDYLALPLAATSVREAIEQTWDVRRAAATIVERKWGRLAANLVADEGGLAVPEEGDELPLALLIEAIAASGHDVGIALDIAANEIDDREGLLDAVTSWVNEYPIVSVEDVMPDDDWDGWAEAARRLRGVQLVGDDLLATNSERVELAAEREVINSVLVKPNQIGTLSGAFAALDAGHRHGMRAVVSARSGDTEDSAIADLAVGWGAGQIKIGSLTRSERLAKYNRLIELEQRFDLPYAGWQG